MLIYLADAAHYREVIERIPRVEHTLWLGTADIKDLYTAAPGGGAVPLLADLAGCVARGVAIRLIHAKEPGPNFQADFDRYPNLVDGLERALCPRVHFKLVIFDLTIAYIGSANLTGAGIGMKASTRRNFEAGILTDNPDLVGTAIEQYDAVWRGEHCLDCGRRAYCPDPIA